MYKSLFLIVICLVSLSAFGLQLSPSSYELASSGSLSSHVFDVVNDSNKIIAVQISVTTREWTLDQKEVNHPSANFDIFPAQMILQPSEKKGVRIRWKGNKKLTHEKPFRLFVEQLPVSFSKNQKDSAMKVLHKVIGALYVTPSKAKAELDIGSPNKEFVIDKKSGNRLPLLCFDVNNFGTKHILLSNAGLVVKGEKNVILTYDMFSTLNTQNVLPGAMLRVKLPWPSELGADATAIDVQ